MTTDEPNLDTKQMETQPATESPAGLPPLAEILERNLGWLDEAVDTKEASKITGDPVSTLETLRCRGGGPPFIKRGKSVRYIRRRLFEYNAAGERRSTSDPGPTETAA